MLTSEYGGVSHEKVRRFTKNFLHNVSASRPVAVGDIVCYSDFLSNNLKAWD
jgi:hypothetical protein